MSDDHAQTLRDYARLDWLYAAPAYRVLHALGEGDADPDIWAFTGVTFACGATPPDGIANIPGVFSRMGLPRCPGCCDATGLPRGKGSPKNDDACRGILGLSVKESA
jgi:hypothetical protein